MEEEKPSSNSDLLRFYNSGILIGIVCKDEELHVNKETLLNNADLKQSKFISIKGDINEVRKFKRDTIQKFLNVVMGFENLHAENFSIILPVAYKYDVKQLLEKIINYIKDNSNLKNIVLAFNVALRMNHDDLLNYCFDFIFQFGINKLFEEEQDNCYLLLWPSSVLSLLRTAEKNYLFLKSFQKWADYYMKKNNIQKNMLSFLSDHKFTGLLKLNEVKSFDKVLDLYSNNPETDLFEAKHYLDSLKKIAKNEM